MRYLSALVTLAGLNAAVMAQPRYSVVVIDSLPGMYPQGSMSPGGAVCGMIYIDLACHSFRTLDGATTEILSTTNSWAFGINDAGRTVGEIDRHNGSFVLVSDPAQPPMEISPLGGRFSAGAGVGPDGTVIGGASLPGRDTSRRPFRWLAGVGVELPIPANANGWATAIDDTASIAGYALSPNDECTPLWWRHGRMLQLPMPRDAAYAIPRALNSRGTILGEFRLLGESRTHVCLWENGSLTILPDDGNYAYPTGINDTGQVVGISSDGQVTRAVTWVDGQLMNLTSLQPRDDVALWWAIGIDAFGRIAAFAKVGDDDALVMLVPSCSPDYNHDGTPASDADIEAFFACIAGNCCPTCTPDFNSDGDSATDADIEAFFRVIAGGTC